MPVFGSPFSGLANDRMLTQDELIRAIRFMVASEYEATQLYAQLADSTDNASFELVRAVRITQLVHYFGGLNVAERSRFTYGSEMVAGQ